MKERQIIFSGPMVRAILDGRKTQTRRIVKPGRDGSFGITLAACEIAAEINGADPDYRFCPYGQPGDLLWVRETWFEEFDPLTVKPYDPPRAVYRATEERDVMQMDGDGGCEWNKDGTAKSPWKPSINMPRWASRLTLWASNPFVWCITFERVTP